jgi:hypothetical protein
MITPRQCVAFAALCVTVALAGWGADRFVFGTSSIGDGASPIGERVAAPAAISPSPEIASIEESRETVTGALGETTSSAQPSTTEMQLASLPPKPAKDAPNETVSLAETKSSAHPSTNKTQLASLPPSPANDDRNEISTASPATVTDPLGEAKAASASAAEASSADDSSSVSPPEKPTRLVSAFPSKAALDEPLPPVPPSAITNECLAAETCVDDYLWSLYERTPKVDTNKVITKIKKAIKKEGKLKTIIASITNYVVGDFTWKDPAAAQKANKPLKEYVIGGMDPKFKLKLYRALRSIEAAGFMPGITSAFRDDYRQSIAEGNKASSDSSYHGGSRRGGFGRGLAVDLVSVKGENRLQRLAASDAMWKWIDAHEKELGIGRPYRDRDPPHVGPLDGKEYADKRGRATAKQEAAKAKTAKTETKKPEPKKAAPVARQQAGTTKPAAAEKSAKVSSLESLTVER